MQGQRGGRLTMARRGPAAQAPAFCLLCMGAGVIQPVRPSPAPSGAPHGPLLQEDFPQQRGTTQGWVLGVPQHRQRPAGRALQAANEKPVRAQVGWGGRRPPGECQAPHLAC